MNSNYRRKNKPKSMPESYLETIILKLDKVEMELDTMKSAIYKNMQKAMCIEEKITELKKGTDT